MLTKKSLVLLALVVLVLPGISYSHCQIPCGIYDDEARFKLLEEHVTTIEKSMKMINELSSSKEQNMNQLVRWINNKEEHAVMFSEIITDYFMAQRVVELDPKVNGYEGYVKKISLLHHMLRVAMKCKQTADTVNTAKLSELVKEFKGLYLSEN